MWTSWRILYVKVDTPDTHWLRFPIPFIVLYTLLDPWKDLMALIFLFVPRRVLAENSKWHGMQMISQYSDLIMKELGKMKGQDLVTVDVGADHVNICIRVL